MGALARTLGDPDGAELLDFLGDYLAALSANPGALNLSLAYSVGSSALTIAAKQQGGSDASADQPIIAGMRSSTATSGDFNVRSITAALSTVVSNGSTLGHGNSDSRWVNVYLIDNAGTLELAYSSKLFGMQGIVSTTAEGGAGGADSATVMYSTTARSNVPFIWVGRFKAPQTAAGTWAAVPTSAETGGMLNADTSRVSIYTYTAWDPSDVANTLTNASNSAASSSAATDYITAANSSGTLTFTCVTPGIYRFTITQQNENQTTSTQMRMLATLGGTATIHLGTATQINQYEGSDTGSSQISGTSVFCATMTPGQTVTILPKFSVASGGVTTQFTNQCTVSAEYVSPAP